MKGKYNYSRKKKKENGDNSSGSGNFNRREDGNENKNKNKNKGKSKSKKNKNNLMSLTIKFFVHFTNVIACIEAIIKTYHFIKGIYKEVYDKIINTYRKIKDNILKIIISTKEEIDKPNSSYEGKYNSLKCNEVIIPINLRLECPRTSIFQINPDLKILDNLEKFEAKFTNKSDESDLIVDTNKTNLDIEGIVNDAQELIRMRETYYSNVMYYSNMKEMKYIVDVELKDREIEEMEKIKVKEVVDDRNEEIEDYIEMIKRKSEHSSLIQEIQSLSKEEEQSLDNEMESFLNSYDYSKISDKNDVNITDAVVETQEQLGEQNLSERIDESQNKFSDKTFTGESEQLSGQNLSESIAAFWDKLGDKTFVKKLEEKRKGENAEIARSK